MASTKANGQVTKIMNFWVGLLIGVFIGANLGVLVAGLLLSSKRHENSIDATEMKLADESSIVETDSKYARSHRHRVRSAKPHDEGPRGTLNE